MAKNDRRITGSVLKAGRFYKAGDEEALAAVLPAHDVQRLVGNGELTGDWDGAGTAPEPELDTETEAGNASGIGASFTNVSAAAAKPSKGAKKAANPKAAKPSKGG